MTHFTFVTALPCSEVVRLLRENTDSPWKFFGKGTIIGAVGHSSFRLSKRINYRNSFRTHLFGRLTRENNATRIDCRTGMHILVIAFMTVWFGFLVAFALPVTLAISTQQPLSPVTLVPLAMVLLGVLLVWFGRWLSRGDVEELVAFVENTLGAERAD